MLLGSRDGYVEKTSLFLQVLYVVNRHQAWEDVFLESNDEHRVELQALGGVNGHERNLVVRAIVAVRVGHQ